MTFHLCRIINTNEVYINIVDNSNCACPVQLENKFDRYHGRK